MKLITCTGYYGTGSSAITDLISEFDNVYSLGDYEFRFVQDPEGISDLEYNLVENHHRHNSGHALKRYKKKVDFLSKIHYEKYFNKKFKQISYNYIENLTDFKCKGMWHQDVIDRGKIFYFFERLINKIYMVNRKLLTGKSERGITLLKNEITLYSKPGENFYKITRNYIDELFKVANCDNKEFVMVDQLVPPSNINRYMKYFNDLKVIIVDRDPRDLYILEKKYWKGTVIPCENVKIFCEWFIYTRENINNDNKNIMKIKFEELIYQYDKSLKKIVNFLNLNEENHINKEKIFNRKISVKNTKLWEKNIEFAQDIKYIENKLSQYLYDYKCEE